jgi:hypothetical protein
MNSLLQRVLEQSTQPFEAAVVIGAGNESGLAVLRKLSAKRLILVEGHPQQAEKLSRWIWPDQNEELHSLVITIETAPAASLYPCNNPNFSSIASPERLLESAPNLRFADPIEVPAQSFDEFISTLQLTNTANNLLLLDTPGISSQLLINARPESLHLFSWIIIRDGAVAELYQNMCSVQEAVNFVTAIGFDSIAEDDQALYPQAAHLLARHPERLGRYTLERQIQTMQEALVDAQITADEQQTLIEALSQQLELLDKDNSTLAQEKDKLLHAFQELKNRNQELDEQVEQLHSEKQNFSRLNEEQKARIQTLKTQKDSLAEENTSLLNARNALQQTTDEQEAFIGELKRQHQQLGQQIEQLHSEKQNFSRLNEEQKARIQTLKTQKDSLAEENTSLLNAKNALQKTTDEQKAFIGELKQQHQQLGQQIEQLHNEKQNVAHLNEEQKVSIQTLKTQKDSLAEEKAALTLARDKLQQTLDEQKSTLENLTKARNAAQAQLREKDEQLARIESHSKEQEHRQLLLQEELIKAEAQIELIKDLLLRDPGL